MIYIRVDGEWYSTKYERYEQLRMYESGHAKVVYDDITDTILANTIMMEKKFIDPMTYEQVKLELFLQGGKFHEWSMHIHRFGENLTSHRMNLNCE